VLDSTAAATIEGFMRKVARRWARFYIAGALPAVRRVLLTHGVRPPKARFLSDVAHATEVAQRMIGEPPTG
jgi:SulP family sulfate permease